MKNDDMVTLVTTDILVPYKRGEVFTVTPAQADKLLRPDMSQTDFGPRYPKVKVRKFDPKKDKELLLENKYLNQEEHDALQEELVPGSVPHLQPEANADIVEKAVEDEEEAPKTRRGRRS